MERIRNAEDAKKRAEASVAYYETRIKEWEKVQRVRTKAGENFKVLSKNFINCKFVNQYGTDYLKIYFQDEKGAYTYDDIYLGRNVYTNTPGADTPEEIEKRITAVIAQYRENLETAEKGLEAIDALVTATAPHLEALKEIIEEARKVNDHYIIGSYIKNTLNILND